MLQQTIPPPAPPYTKQNQFSKRLCFGTEGQAEEGGTQPHWIPVQAPASGDNHQDREPAYTFPGPRPAHAHLYMQAAALGRVHPVFGEAMGAGPSRPAGAGAARDGSSASRRKGTLTPAGTDQPFGRAVLRSPDPVVSCNHICD